MKYILLLLITSPIALFAQSQQPVSKIDLRLGTGTSFLGTGDLQTIMLENELNIKLNQYFTLSEGISFGKSDDGIKQQASFFQFNSNVYFSPFKNGNKNDLRIGTGLSLHAIQDLRQSFAVYKNQELVYSEYTFEKWNTIGLNLIIEHAYTLNDKIIIGLKLFTQPYFNGDINSGILLKVGHKIKN